MRQAIFLTLTVVFLGLVSSLQQVFAQDIARLFQLITGLELLDAKWSPDGQLLAVGGDWGVKIFDPTLGEIAQLQGHTGAVVSVSWNPNSSQLASAGGIDDGTIRIWDRNITTGEFTFQTALSNNHEREFVVAWSPDGTRIASIGADAPVTALQLQAETEIWETSTWTLQRTVNMQYQTLTKSLVWTNDGSTVIGAGRCVSSCPQGFSSGIYFADATTGNITNFINTDADSIKALTLDTNSRLGVSQDIGIDVYHTQTLQRIYGYEFCCLMNRLAWSPDGGYIAFGYDGGSGGVIEISNGTVFEFVPSYTGGMTGIDWHPDGTKVATVTRQGLIEIWGVSDLPDTSGTPTVTPLATLPPTNV
jgi:WD40 repeat protein